MKIVYCIRNTFASGGMTRVLANKANYWVEQMGQEVTVVTVDQQNRVPFYFFSSKVKHYDLGIKYRNGVKIPFLSSLLTLMTSAEHHRKLKDLLRTLKADIVVSMFDSEARFLYRIKDGSKKVLEVHFSKWGREQHNKSAGGRIVDYVKKKYDERIVGKYDAFVVLTEEDKRCWKQARNIFVIPNALMFKPAHTARPDSKIVLAVGKLTAQKGYDFLIDIWQKVNARYPDWKLKIVGEGEDQLLLEKKIKENALSGKVEIHPFTKEVEACYVGSSIYVLSSRYEGFGMVVVEAMACGLPVVSFACPSGPSEIIKDGEDGFLIPVGDLDLFAERVCQLMEDRELRRRMGEQAKKNVRRFDEEEIMKKWSELFNMLIENKTL